MKMAFRTGAVRSVWLLYSFSPFAVLARISATLFCCLYMWWISNLCSSCFLHWFLQVSAPLIIAPISAPITQLASKMKPNAATILPSQSLIMPPPFATLFLNAPSTFILNFPCAGFSHLSHIPLHLLTGIVLMFSVSNMLFSHLVFLRFGLKKEAPWIVQVTSKAVKYSPCD